MKTVDIIILSWDRTEDTIEAIRSATQQEGVDVRIQVVDQGSQPDGLRQLKAFCDGFPNISLLCNTKNTGVPGGRNQASEMGDAEFIVALDNDAVFTDTRVCERAAAMMSERPELGALGFRIDIYESPLDNPVPDRSSWAYGPLDADEWAGKEFPASNFVGAGHMIRREAFEKVGSYDARMFFMHEEVDFSDRLINAGYRIEYQPSLGVRHKVAAERRVAWNGGRLKVHIRNLVYLQVKQHRSWPGVFADLFIFFLGGVRAGFTGGSIKAVVEFLGLLPGGIHERRHNPYTRRSEEGAAFLKEVNALKAANGPVKVVDAAAGKSKIGRFFHRLTTSSKFDMNF